MEWIFEPFLDVSHIFEQKKRTDVRDVPEGKRGEKKNAFQNGGRCSHISRPRNDGEAKKYKHKRRNEGNEVDEARSSWLDWILPRSSVLFLPRRAKKAKKRSDVVRNVEEDITKQTTWVPSVEGPERILIRRFIPIIAYFGHYRPFKRECRVH